MNKKRLLKLKIFLYMMLAYVGISIIYIGASLFIDTGVYTFYHDILSVIFCLVVVGYAYENWHVYIQQSKLLEKEIINLLTMIDIEPPGPDNFIGAAIETEKKLLRKKRRHLTLLFLLSLVFAVFSIVWTILKNI